MYAHCHTFIVSWTDGDSTSSNLSVFLEIVLIHEAQSIFSGNINLSAGQF